MKSFFDWLKDFIYDSIDYFIMIAIVISVVFIIGWRLDILFAKDTSDLPKKPPIVVDGPDTDGDNIADNKGNDDEDDVVNPDNTPDTLPEDNANLDEPPEETDTGDNPDPGTPPTTPNPAPVTVRVNIPDGTLPSGIGAILESNGLVSNKNDFVIQAQSMELDRKLRSGTYEISNNSSLEEIIKIIARQN